MSGREVLDVRRPRHVATAWLATLVAFSVAASPAPLLLVVLPRIPPVPFAEVATVCIPKKKLEELEARLRVIAADLRADGFFGEHVRFRPSTSGNFDLPSMQGGAETAGVALGLVALAIAGSVSNRTSKGEAEHCFFAFRRIAADTPSARLSDALPTYIRAAPTMAEQSRRLHRAWLEGAISDDERQAAAQVFYALLQPVPDEVRE